MQSPEVMGGAAGDATADIWSLGITAIELAQGGVAPYADEPLPVALRLLRSEDPPTLPTNCAWSQEFHDFVKSCLVRDPLHRPLGPQLLEHPLFEKFRTLTIAHYSVSYYGKNKIF